MFKELVNDLRISTEGNISKGNPPLVAGRAGSAGSTGEPGACIRMAYHPAMNWGSAWTFDLWFAADGTLGCEGGGGLLVSRANFKIKVRDINVEDPGKLEVIVCGHLLRSRKRVDDMRVRHVTITQDCRGGPAAVLLYINGVYDWESVPLGVAPHTFDDMLFLCNGAAGLLNDAAFYKKAMTADEVRAGHPNDAVSLGNDQNPPP